MTGSSDCRAPQNRNKIWTMEMNTGFEKFTVLSPTKVSCILLARSWIISRMLVLSHSFLEPGGRSRKDKKEFIDFFMQIQVGSDDFETTLNTFNRICPSQKMEISIYKTIL